MSSDAGGLSTYVRVLRQPAVRFPFLAAVVARLPFSMAPLGMVLLIQDVRGSYSLAGLVTGAFAVGGAVGSPVWGRAMDRLGQARVILPTILVSALLLVTLAVAATGDTPDALLIVLSWGAGAATPPMSSAMRTTFRRGLPDEVERRAGYALDAVAVETIFVGGPLLLSLLLVVTPDVVPLLVTAALLALGGVTYALLPTSRTAPEPIAAAEHEHRGLRGAIPPGLPLVFSVSCVLAVAFGTIDTSLAATAREVFGNEGRLGVLFAFIAGGSAVGGFYYGTRASHEREHRRLPFTVGCFAAGLLPISLLLRLDSPPMWSILPFLFLAGLCIAPSMIIQQNIIDAVSPAGRLNEAQAWLSTSITTGAAAGTAIAGAVIDSAGVAWSFTGAVAAIAAAAGLAAAGQPRWDRALRRERPAVAVG